MAIIEIEPTTDSNARQCISTEEERLLRLRARYEPRRGFMVVVRECNEDTSTWMNLCDRQSTTLNIIQVCDKLGGKITAIEANSM